MEFVLSHADDKRTKDRVLMQGKSVSDLRYSYVKALIVAQGFST